MAIVVDGSSVVSVVGSVVGSTVVASVSVPEEVASLPEGEVPVSDSLPVPVGPAVVRFSVVASVAVAVEAFEALSESSPPHATRPSASGSANRELRMTTRRSMDPRVHARWRNHPVKTG
ncbi:MAG: hypothetical protein KC636_14935 [Myxococcales bacterium]|nr:hypothetical protein [Myxococcales bacterium]